MLQELRGMDVGFLSSIAMLMASCRWAGLYLSSYTPHGSLITHTPVTNHSSHRCSHSHLITLTHAHTHLSQITHHTHTDTHSVLDWNAYERFNKSEPAQTMTTTNDGELLLIILVVALPIRTGDSVTMCGVWWS